MKDPEDKGSKFVQFNGDQMSRAGASLQAYTCIGKGGHYERIGTALGAGSCRGEIIEVYRDTKTSQLYFRETSEFFLRMDPVSTTV